MTTHQNHCNFTEPMRVLTVWFALTI
uniref:Uncharacterized protein n=1 Tax=Anguilla anguilla TaxID=7936 RepID=A0A0E9TNY0_ANGAN